MITAKRRATPRAPPVANHARQARRRRGRRERCGGTRPRSRAARRRSLADTHASPRPAPPCDSWDEKTAIARSTAAVARDRRGSSPRPLRRGSREHRRQPLPGRRSWRKTRRSVSRCRADDDGRRGVPLREPVPPFTMTLDGGLRALGCAPMRRDRLENVDATTRCPASARAREGTLPLASATSARVAHRTMAQATGPARPGVARPHGSLSDPSFIVRVRRLRAQGLPQRCTYRACRVAARGKAFRPPCLPAACSGERGSSEAEPSCSRGRRGVTHDMSFVALTPAAATSLLLPSRRAAENRAPRADRPIETYAADDVAATDSCGHCARTATPHHRTPSRVILVTPCDREHARAASSSSRLSSHATAPRPEVRRWSHGCMPTSRGKLNVHLPSVASGRPRRLPSLPSSSARLLRPSRAAPRSYRLRRPPVAREARRVPGSGELDATLCTVCIVPSGGAGTERPARPSTRYAASRTRVREVVSSAHGHATTTGLGFRRAAPPHVRRPRHPAHRLPPRIPPT